MWNPKGELFNMSQVWDKEKVSDKNWTHNLQVGALTTELWELIESKGI